MTTVCLEKKYTHSGHQTGQFQSPNITVNKIFPSSEQGLRKPYSEELEKISFIVVIQEEQHHSS